MFEYLYIPGREEGKGPPTGKFMGACGLVQFWDAEFKYSWYTSVGSKVIFPIFCLCCIIITYTCLRGMIHRTRALKETRDMLFDKFRRIIGVLAAKWSQ